MFSKNTLFSQLSNGYERGSLFIPCGADVTFLPNPTGESYKRIKRPLFESPPSIDDVRQGAYGDCFLLAALQAILVTPDGPEIISGMFSDEGDHIVVRLFDDENKPHYLKLEKSVPERRFDLCPSRVLWVKLIEKAYAAFKKGDISVFQGGFPDKAMQVLTGAYYEGDCRFPLQSRKRLAEVTEYTNGNGIYLFHELMRLDKNTPQQIRQKIVTEIFLDETEWLSRWETWLHKKNYATQWQQLLSKTQTVELRDVEKFFNSGIDFDVLVCAWRILNWLTTEMILPNAALSAQYSYEELALFEDIKKHLANQQALFVGVIEAKSEYVAKRHSYSVEGVEESNETTFKFILVRAPNPNILYYAPKWASSLFAIGRSAKEINVKQHQSQLEIVQSWEVGKAYRMELNDFCRSFDCLKSTKPISKEAIEARVEKYYSNNRLLKKV